MNKKAIFFSPHVNIWVHAFPEALVAETLADQGYSVTIVGCRGLLSQRCTTFDALGVRGVISPQLRKKTCNQCISKQRKLDKHICFHRLWLDDFLTEQDIKEVDNEIGDKDTPILRQSEYLGIPVGHLASYETLLTYKKLDHSFVQDELVEYKSNLRGCMLALRGFKKILVEEQNVSFLFTYNSLYSVNRSVTLFAETRGIKTYSLHGGNHAVNRYNTLIIARKNQVIHTHHLISLWTQFACIPCSHQAATSVTDHILEIFRGRNPWAYSTPLGQPIDIRERFKIKPNQKILLATMSSYDEQFAAESIGLSFDKGKILFDSQASWIEWLIKYMTSRHDLFLVIRVHPREFPNKREKRLSEHAQKLSSQFKNLPENVVVNWPTDNFSLYNLLTEVDVILNAWSSVGKEASMLGLPVVLYSSNSQFVNYPTSLNFVGDSLEAYKKAIESALAQGWSFERIRYTYRWLALEQVYSVLDISDSFSPYVNKHDFSKFFLKKVQRVLNIDTHLYEDCKRRSRPLRQGYMAAQMLQYDKFSIADVNSIPETSLEQETQSLIIEIKRILNLIDLKNRSVSPLLQAIHRFLECQVT